MSTSINEVYGQQQESAIIRIVNPLSGDPKFVFNATEHPINSTFTVEFYIVNVKDMVGWQIYVKWNTTIINFTDVWIPPDNVFAQVIEEEGWTLIKPPSSFEIDPITGMGYVKCGAQLLGPTEPGQGVDATIGLLCRANFTIKARPAENETLSTNIEIIKEAPGSAPGSLDTFIQKYEKYKEKSMLKKVEVLTEPGIVRIIKQIIKIYRDIAILGAKVSKSKAEVGDEVKILVQVGNFGSDLEAFNISIYCGDTLLCRQSLSLNPFTNDTFTYYFNTTQIGIGTYKIRVEVEHLEDEIDTDNNEFEIASFQIVKKTTALDYALWLLSLWLSTPLGIVAMAYTMATAGIFVILYVIRRR